MLIDFAIIYLIVYFSLLVHELMHYIVARMLRMDVFAINIGFEAISHKRRKLSISPIVGPSYIEVAKEQLVEKKTIQVLMYFMAGIFGNLLLGLLMVGLLFFIDNNIVLIGLIFNLLLVLINAIPIGKTDISTLIRIIKEKNEL